MSEKRVRAKYTPEFKIEAVRQVGTQIHPLDEIAVPQGHILRLLLSKIGSPND